MRRVVLSFSTAHAADSSRTFTSVATCIPLPLHHAANISQMAHRVGAVCAKTQFSMPEVSATTFVSLMMRRITKLEMFPNVLGRLFLCVATLDQYRNRCLLHTSLVGLGSFLHLSEDACVDLARRVLFFISSQRRISVGILDDLITPCPVYCCAVPCHFV